MWFLAVMWISSLLVGTQAQSTASFWKGNDRNKRCQYTFTVDSPTEASCPSTASNAEMEALKSRLGLVEALIARLTGGEASGTEAQMGLRTAYTQVTRERDRLQQEKTRLSQQVEQLQQTVEELQREVERLRSRPCTQPPPQSVSLYDSSLQPGTGEYSSLTLHYFSFIPLKWLFVELFDLNVGHFGISNSSTP